MYYTDATSPGPHRLALAKSKRTWTMASRLMGGDPLPVSVAAPDSSDPAQQ